MPYKRRSRFWWTFFIPPLEQFFKIGVFQQPLAIALIDLKSVCWWAGLAAIREACAPAFQLPVPASRAYRGGRVRHGEPG
jgi:hypothetical protein